LKKKIIIGSRGSELALRQANFVKRELEKKHQQIIAEIKIVKTKGDKILDVALSKIGDKSIFTKELETQLIERKIDIAVHSLKDLQTQLPEELKLAAVSKRHPVEDVLIAKKKGTTLDNLRENAIVATGSLRRKCQLLHLRPDIKVVDLRGNVPSRIQRFLKSDWDAVILARAGIERLNLKKYISSYISTNHILPAVGQGAIGVETHIENNFVNDLLLSLHDENTYIAVAAELEGGCQVPIGAFAEVKSNGLFLDSLIGSLDGTLTFRKKMRGSKNNPEQLGVKLANNLLNAGAKEILYEIYNSVRSNQSEVA
jgi:hydroxymethylbilane synthase